MECFRCGVSGKDEKLLEVIHKTGVVPICVRCYSKVRLPIVEKKHIDLNEVLKKKTVKERLEDISHVSDIAKTSPAVKSPEDVSLREIVERNFNQNKIEKDDVPEDLLENFNWVIMRRRRSLKMSQIQLCEKIGEPEVIVHALEKGTLPKDYVSLIKKVENALGVRLFKEKKVDSNDILNEAKVPGGILVEEIKEKTKKPFSFNLFKKKESNDEEKEDLGEVDKVDEEKLDLNSLDLDAVNEIVGVPEDSQDTVKKEVEESDNSLNDDELDSEIKSNKIDEDLDSEIKSNKIDEDLDSDDISKIIWGR